MNGLNSVPFSPTIKKLFGVALDPVDDPLSLQLKHAWMAADAGKLDWLSACPDPYHAVTESMAGILAERGIWPVGAFPVPSWLWPKPDPSDQPRVNAENIGEFFDSGSLLEIVKELHGFVKNTVLPETPIMVGIDHSATAGVVSALSEIYGPGNLGVIVLDQHFDAIPLSVRLAGASSDSPDLMNGMPFSPVNVPVGFSDQFCCGNFWAYLVDNGIVLPENLHFIGVADYPERENLSAGNSFQELYLGYEERGCGFFPRRRFEEPYGDALSRFIRDRIKTPYVYVSLDLDVGAYNGVYAARYMDRPGISRQNLLDIAGIVSDECRRGSFRLAGLDVMEFNMHFLGIETPGGIKDETLALVSDFLKALFEDGSEN